MIKEFEVRPPVEDYSFGSELGHRGLLMAAGLGFVERLGDFKRDL